MSAVSEQLISNVYVMQRLHYAYAALAGSNSLSCSCLHLLCAYRTFLWALLSLFVFPSPTIMPRPPPHTPAPDHSET